MSKKRIYIFDADGVVIHPWGFARELEDRYQITREKTLSFFTGPFQQCLIGKGELRSSLKRSLKEWGWTGSIDELIDIWMRADDLPNEAVLEKIKRLRRSGHVCCLASNQECNRANYIREVMGFSDYFDWLFFSCDLGFMKPDIGFYSAIESVLEAKSEDILFIDDTESHVDAALSAGWKAIVYSDVRDFPRTA